MRPLVLGCVLCGRLYWSVCYAAACIGVCVISLMRTLMDIHRDNTYTKYSIT